MVINKEEDVLYKFVLTQISGEPQTAIIHRNLDILGRIKRVSEELVH